MVNAIATAGVSQEEFEKFKNELIQLKNMIKEKLTAMAHVLVQMSSNQIRELKKFAKDYNLSSNFIENLYLCGKGEMNIELAMHPSKINNRVFRSLPPVEKKKLNDLETPVEVVTPRGVVVKPLKDLDAKQIKEVVQPGVGIVPASKQIPIFARKTSTQTRVDHTAENAFEYDGMNVTSDKKVLLYGRDVGSPAGSKTIAIKISQKDWKRIRGG